MPVLSAGQRAAADRLVRPGERLLWSGAPDRGVRFTPADAWFVPFSIAWAAFSVFWEATAATSAAGVFYVLWGAMFVAAGSYITVGRFVVKDRRKRRTVYLLTDQRAVVAIDVAVTEVPWQGRGRELRWHRDGRHVSVAFDSDGGERGGPWARHRSDSLLAMYANTGMEWIVRGRRIGVGFYDVADGIALVDALERPARGW
jgi:hypothetical protein